MSIKMDRIHIFGASGSGTSTLGKALAGRFGWRWFDTDDFFWLPTNPQYQTVRHIDERRQLLSETLQRTNTWTLSGSLCGWGDLVIPLFDLVVFLTVATPIRIDRLLRRERIRCGSERIEPGGDMFEQHQEFIAWAREYDEGGLEVRSRKLHEKWLKDLSCPVVRLEGTTPVTRLINIIETMRCTAMTGGTDI
jgi:adenylate kinase family enzyme